MSSEHMRGWKNGLESNPLTKHQTREEEPEFKILVKRTFRKALERLVAEALLFSKGDPDYIFNSKSE